MAARTRSQRPATSHERRGPDRPSNGDTRTCPKCCAGEIEFSERYRMPLLSGGFMAVPAWLCDSCGYAVPARRLDRAPALWQRAHDLSVSIRRKMMKSRAVLDRARKASARNQVLLGNISGEKKKRPS